MSRAASSRESSRAEPEWVVFIRTDYLTTGYARASSAGSAVDAVRDKLSVRDNKQVVEARAVQISRMVEVKL